MKHVHRKYIALDIETAKIIPKQVTDIKAHRPLGITCAATLDDTTAEPRLWYGRTDSGAPAARMGRDDVSRLVQFLIDATANGATVLTWNGLGFDFDILSEESGMSVECQRLSRDHVDMMFHVFCERGFPIALDNAARGMGLVGKSSSVSQHSAPQLWADGRTDDVLEYVSQDVRATLELARACEEQRALRWVTKKGKNANMRLGSGWLTVRDAIRLPEPDTSWMDRAMQRSRFTSWW